MVDAADQKRMRCAAEMPDLTKVRSGSELAQCTDRTKPAGTPPLSSLRRKKRPHRLNGNVKRYRIPSTLAKTRMALAPKSPSGSRLARSWRAKIRLQDPLQSRTSMEQLAESGTWSDQDHDPGATVAWEPNELE